MTQTKIKNILLSWLIISFFVLLNPEAKSQEMLGVTLGNYNGLTGAMINPSILTNTKNYLEINLITFNYFLWNDFAYLPASDVSIWNLMTSDPNLPTYGEKQNSFLYYRNRNLKNTVLNLRIMGPSAMYQYGKHGFALTTGVRYMATANNVPWEIPVMSYEGLNYEPLLKVNFDDYNSDFGTQAWMEIGLSYAYDVYQSFDQQLTLGISVRGLWSYAGANVQVNNIDYIVLNDSTINFKNLNGQIGYAIPVDYETNDYPITDPFFRGSGFGADIGVTYTKRRYVDNKRFERACDQRHEDYVYRIGLSLIDIGRVKYKSNAQYHSFDDVSAIWQNFDTISYDNVNQVVRELSDVFYGDPDASYRGNEFKIGLPMAVSAQFDYHVPGIEAFYIGAIWIQPIRFNMHTLRRPAQLGIVPRYETKNLEFQVPVTLYEYKYPRIGFSARFGFFTIGTEKIGTYLGLSDLNGMDIYASIKFNFGKGTCKIKVANECLNGEYGYTDEEKRGFKKRR